jgi:hypothetical protein
MTDKRKIICYRYVRDLEEELPRMADLLESWLLQERINDVDGIFKCMDINKDGKIFIKDYLLTEVTRLLSRSDVGVEWMINISNRADLNNLRCEQVLESLRTFIKRLDKPSKISIDAEPLIAWEGDDHTRPVIYNIIDFHIEMCRVVNGDLGLALSIYISPSQLALCLFELMEPLFEELRTNPENVVYIPAYTVFYLFLFKSFIWL